MAIDVSVIIVSWNTEDLLRRCLGSIAAHFGEIAHEVVVVDNASTDGTPDMIAEEFPDVHLIRNEMNRGFGPANNQGMAAARGRYFLLLNSDTEMTDDSVARLVRQFEGWPTVGLAQCRLVFPDGRLQHTAYRFPSMWTILFEALLLYKLLPGRAGRVLLRGYWDYATERDVDWVIGAFMLLRREVFQQTGGFDEAIFLYGEDREWCYRIRQRGWAIRFFPGAEVLHVGHASADLDLGARRRIALCLQRDREFFAEVFGSAKATRMLAVMAVHAGVRAVYYALRSSAPGPNAGAYKAMAPELLWSFRVMVGLLLGRNYERSHRRPSCATS